MKGRKLALPVAVACLAAATVRAEWDGDSWVYDTSQRLEPTPKVEKASFDSTFEGYCGSFADGVLSFLEARVFSLVRSNEAHIDCSKLGLITIIR